MVEREVEVEVEGEVEVEMEWEGVVGTVAAVQRATARSRRVRLASGFPSRHPMALVI